jgi:Ca2+-binding EF-hand superfamily protein
MKKTLLFAGIAALTTAPLIAQEMMGHEGHGMTADEPMTRTEAETRVKARFAEMDANMDGALTLAEIESVRRTRMSEMQGDMFAKMDADKNGSISRAEFDAHHQHMMAGDMAPPMAGHRDMKKMHGDQGGMRRMEGRMFTMADTNKDGVVTQAEATQAALARFDKVDANKDGTISDIERMAARDTMRAEWKAKKGS